MPAADFRRRIRPRAGIRCFLRRADAAAAVEFALVLPLLLILSAGVFETSRAINASRHLTNVANSIANILSMNSTSSVSYVDLQYAKDSTMLVFPEVLADSKRKGIAWSSDISVSLAGITFTPTVVGCTSGCTYKASVAWTTAPAASTTGRACLSVQTAASDTAQPTYATLPADLFTPVPNPSGGKLPPPFVIAVDVAYTWSPLVFTNPLFGKTGQITFRRSAFINPRYVSKINYSVVAGDPGNVGYLCITL